MKEFLKRLVFILGNKLDFFLRLYLVVFASCFCIMFILVYTSTLTLASCAYAHNGRNQWNTQSLPKLP